MRRIEQLNRSKMASITVLGGIFSLMLVLNVLTPYICDDFTYNLNFLTKEPLGSFWEIFPSMYAHSYKMNGRLISHGLAQLFMLLPPVVFDITNALVFTGTVYLVLRLCGTDRNALLLALTFILFWCMPVFGQVVLWQVGALNYFWALTALVLFITPSLLRFRDGRELLQKRWHWTGFCIYGFLFGWYNEIASFVGICMVFCLILLDVWMNRSKLRLHRFLPVLTGALGYLTMLSMPAQSANKQAAGMTMELFLQRLTDCNDKLLSGDLYPLYLFLILFVIGLLARLPGKTLITAALFALAGICANYMPLAASYYPARCLCTPYLMLLMAVLFLAAPLSKGKGFPPFLICGILLLVMALPDGLLGCKDIAGCYRQHRHREQIIATALESGETNVIANAVIPKTEKSAYWDVRDLTNDPETWPNHSMAIFYGLDSLKTE